MSTSRSEIVDIDKQQHWLYPTRDDELDPEHAKLLFEHHCAVLIVENLPVGSEFGIDLASFRVAHKFKGVKLIPPGIHFVFASAVDERNQQPGPRCGFYHDFKAKELLVRRWSTEEEEFEGSFEASDESRDRYLLNIRELDRYLGAYRYSTYKEYLSLTNKLIWAGLVEELIPTDKIIRSVTYLIRDASHQKDDRQTRFKRRTLRNVECPPTEESLLPEMKPDSRSVIRFTEFSAAGPRGRSSHQATPMTSPHMITQWNLDSTMRLEQAFGCDDCGHRRLLAEFQFAFITLVLGHVYYCFEQWRNMLVLVCSSGAGLSKYPSLYIEFARVLQSQLEQVSEDLFVDITHTDNLIRYHLDIFLQNIERAPDVQQDLKREAGRLRELAEHKFGWIFELEPDDERPVIVEL